MRTRNTAFSLAVVLVLLVLLVFAVQQNPQLADWTLFGQSFALSAGVAIASAMLIGFLLAALFVAAFIGAPTDVTTATATTETQAERDLIQSREQYRQLQAEHSRLQTAYNQLAAMPSTTSPASPMYPMSTSPSPSTAQPMSDTPSNPNGPDRERIHIWGVPDQRGANSTSNDSLTGSAAPSNSGDPNTFIAVPSLPSNGTATDGEDRDDNTPSAGATPATAHIARPAPTDTQTDIPPSRQVIRPDGTIVGSEDDTPPPPDDSTDYHPSH